jgi:hypothetical protein
MLATQSGETKQEPFGLRAPAIVRASDGSSNAAVY